MLIPNHNVFSYIVHSVYPGIYLFIFWTECFPKVEAMIVWYYQIYPKVVWKVVYGLMNTITKTKTKNNITKSMSLLFYRAVYHSKNHLIPLEIISNISKRRTQQQYASQILQIQPLLKTIEK